MPNTFSTRDELELEAAAWKQFDCQPLATSGSAHDRKRDRQREKKRRHVSSVSSEFFRVMNSDSPPLTEDEAVGIILPIGAWLFSWLIQSIAAAIVRWLWQRTQQTM